MPNEKNDDFEFSSKGLDNLIKAFKGKTPMAKLGVLGGNSMRDGDGTNAEILKKHEFGDETVPMRSVLRAPIILMFQKYLDRAGLFEENAVNEKSILTKKSFIDLVAKIGIIGEQVVADAFQTGGFGQWKPSNMKNKKNHQTLVETQQLRTSISSVVEGD